MAPDEASFVIPAHDIASTAANLVVLLYSGVHFFIVWLGLSPQMLRWSSNLVRPSSGAVAHYLSLTFVEASCFIDGLWTFPFLCSNRDGLSFFRLLFSRHCFSSSAHWPSKNPKY